MKERLKRCYAVMCSPVTGAAVLLCCCCVFVSLLLGTVKNLTLWKYMVTLPEPEHCALCNEAVREAPCLVKLETGTIEPLSENLSVPQDAQYINPCLFCRDCRANIAESVDGAAICTTGYVLADLHDLDHIQTYAVTAGATYDIRGYTVTVSETKHEFTLSVTEYPA